MLVDDDPTILQTGRSMLKEYFDVFPLPSVDKLFEALKKVSPDLILLDIQMPGINGFEAITLLKTDDRYKKIPIIFLTSSSDRESVIKGITLHAADFVIKPFSSSDLLNRINNTLDTDDKKKQTILVIDDSPEILMTVYTMLHKTYKIYTLPTPNKLEDLLQHTTPDLFLLDYKIPELSGFDIIPVIRKFSKHKDTPIIILTSDGTEDCLIMAHLLGACDFIVKPFESRVLHKKVAKHIVKKS
jgi:DNA-binding response OmpR family regulator